MAALPDARTTVLRLDVVAAPDDVANGWRGATAADFCLVGRVDARAVGLALALLVSAVRARVDFAEKFFFLAAALASVDFVIAALVRALLVAFVFAPADFAAPILAPLGLAGFGLIRPGFLAGVRRLDVRIAIGWLRPRSLFSSRIDMDPRLASVIGHCLAGLRCSWSLATSGIVTRANRAANDAGQQPSHHLPHAGAPIGIAETAQRAHA